MTKPLTIAEMRILAKKRGGRCLSAGYINGYEKLKWRCARRHTWKASPFSVKSGRWCPICGLTKKKSNRKLTIKEMQSIAKKHGGKCLSKHYINNDTNLKWQCKKKHIWFARPADVKKGTWCIKCFRKRQGK